MRLVATSVVMVLYSTSSLRRNGRFHTLFPSCSALVLCCGFQPLSLPLYITNLHFRINLFSRPLRIFCRVNSIVCRWVEIVEWHSLILRRINPILMRRKSCRYLVYSHIVVCPCAVKSCLRRRRFSDLTCGKARVLSFDVPTQMI